MKSRPLIAALLISIAGSSIGHASPRDVTHHATPHGQIFWDKYGIPHIYGNTIEDVLYGLGFTHMENHAEVLLTKVAKARGRTAEYFGGTSPEQDIGLLSGDLEVQNYDIPTRAESWLKQGSDEQRRLIQAYCDGINAYAKQHGSSIDAKFRQVLPVVPSDTLAMIQNFMHFSWMAHHNHVDTLEGAWKGAPTTPQNTGDGSNAWALAPAKTRDGHTILMANPHLGYPSTGTGSLVTVDQQAMEAHLVTGDPNRPNLNSYGLALVGWPFFVIGFTDDIAWTHTDNTLKNIDLYDVALQGPNDYLFDGKKLKLKQRQVKIRVRQSDGALLTKQFTVKSSIHGPIVAERNDGHVLALRVAGLDGASVVSEFWTKTRAHNLAEFNAAIKGLQFPFTHNIFADRKGEIEYVFTGKVPVRKGGAFADYIGILDGNTSKTFWTETLRFDSLPRTANPPGGFVQNSNDPPWVSTFPQTLFPSDFPAWLSPESMYARGQEGAVFLLSKKKFTLDEVINGKNDTKMFIAGRLLPDLIAAAKASGDPVAAQAAGVLEKWDQTSNADSRGAALFERWAELYSPDAAPANADLTLAPDDVLCAPSCEKVFKTKWSPDKPLTTPIGLANASAAVPALIAAAKEFQQKGFRIDVEWGAFHRIQLGTWDPKFAKFTVLKDDPVSGARDWFGALRVANNWTSSVGAIVGNTPENRHVTFQGDTYVHVVDFDPHGPVKAKALLVYGNASRPNSPHIIDQLPIFSAKELRPVLRERAEVVKNAVSTEEY